MRTGTLALFRDFHGDNRPARDPHGRNVEENGRERKNDGDGDGPGSSGRIGGDARRTYSFGGVGNRPW